MHAYCYDCAVHNLCKTACKAVAGHESEAAAAVAAAALQQSGILRSMTYCQFGTSVAWLNSMLSTLSLFAVMYTVQENTDHTTS